MTLASGGSARLIRETLDSVVAPAVRDALVGAALEECGLTEVPSDTDAFREFVEGPLRQALVQGLGPELAESIVDELERMTQMAENPRSTQKPVRRSSRSTARSASPPPRRNTPTHRRSLSPRSLAKAATMPAVGVASPPPPPPSSGRQREEPADPTAPTIAPPSPTASRPIGRLALTPAPYSAPTSGPVSTKGWGSDEYPMGAAGKLGVPGAGPESVRSGQSYVLVASSDATLIRRLTPWLDQAAEIVPLANLRELVRDLEVLGENARVAILIDCKHPSIRPTAIAALADELPPTAHVILWGASVEQERGVLAVSPSVSRWVVLHGETRPKELAARCVDLVG